jgi:dTDP-glucose 4,6-dehydratase
LKRLLVTGGCGFIGSNFVRYMLEAHSEVRLTVLDALTYAGNLDNLPARVKHNPRFDFWQGDVRNAELVGALVRECDAVVHFAAETHVARSIYDNRTFFETDVMGTQTLANAAVKHGVERFLHISSSEVYGTAEFEPMDERHPLNPRSPYASAKAGADRLVYAYHLTYDLPCVILRPFNNYGPCQHLEKAVPRFLTSALRGEPLTLHGTGGNTRDWLYVEDHCEALDLALHADPSKVVGQVINLGTGREISLAEVARIILEAVGPTGSEIRHVTDRPGQVSRHLSSTEKAERLLGWKAGTPFHEGIRKTLAWFLENRQWWERLLWMKDDPACARNGRRFHD